MTTIETNQPVNDNFGMNDALTMFSQQNIDVSGKDSSRFSPSKKRYGNLDNANPSPTDTVSTLNLSEHSSPTNSAVSSPILLSIQKYKLDSSNSPVEAQVVFVVDDECPSQMKRFSDGKTRGCGTAKLNNIVIDQPSSTLVISVPTNDVGSNSIQSSPTVVVAPTVVNTFVRPQLVKTDSCKSARSLALLFNVDDSDSDNFAEKILDSSRKERERESFDNINTFFSNNSISGGLKIGSQQQPVTILNSNNTRISCSVQQRKQSDAPRMIPQQHMLPKSTSAHSLIDPSVTQRQIKVNELRKIITPLYEKHNPKKLIVVDSLIFSYCDGKEFSLFLQLKEKYTLSIDELELFDNYLKKYDKQCGSASAKGISQTPRSVVSPRATSSSSNSDDKTDVSPPSLQRVVSNKPSIPALPFDKLHPSSPGYIPPPSIISNSTGGKNDGGKNKLTVNNNSNKTVGSMIANLSKSSSMNMSGSAGSLTPSVSKNNGTSSNNSNITAGAADLSTTGGTNDIKATTIAEKKKRRVKCVIC